MPKRTIKLNLKLPSGVVATKELVDQATQAAKDVIDASAQDITEATRTAEDLARRGFDITADELLGRKKSSGGGVKKSATRKGAATKSAAKGVKGVKGAKKAKKAKKTGGRKRVVLSSEQKSALVNELKDGMKISEATKKYGVSTATVMNVKKAAGLTKGKGGK